MDDAPTWLIYKDSDGELVWSRVPDGDRVSDLVDAELIAGGHTDPGDVLDWLQGKSPDPWACGNGWGDDTVLKKLMDKLSSS